jgi:hypothetical protein
LNTIITPEELIKFSSSDLSMDNQEDVEKLEFYCQMATDYFSNLFGYSLELSQEVERLKGNNQDRLYLKKRPIVEVESLKINGIEVPSSKFTITKDYIQLNSGIFKQGFDIKFPYLSMRTIKSDEIEVIYQAGYKFRDKETGEVGNVPYDLKMACCLLAKNLMYETSDIGNVKSYKIGDISYSFADKLERDETFKSILNKYLW